MKKPEKKKTYGNPHHNNIYYNRAIDEYEKFLPRKIDIVTIIVDEMVRYRTDKRFKMNARMSGKNWTIANWLAKAISKRIRGKK